MNRGERSGGGQSSLKYLFGSEERQNEAPPPKTVPISLPPYGIDIDNHKSPAPSPSPSTIQVIQPSHGQHLGNILTNRPSTKVKSAPGGESSLGYLFGDK
ncbi:hypothetical protein VNO77_00518 [Canavalia gladiata]|uniref:Protein SPIRAL1-like 5 n=1 Tax=Canavalia gladiata TaxID=3824 RepID=A0AAN9MU49_CANGL